MNLMYIISEICSHLDSSGRMTRVSLRGQIGQWSVERPVNGFGKVGWKPTRAVRSGDSSMRELSL
jgi:hypothetical protein